MCCPPHKLLLSAVGLPVPSPPQSIEDNCLKNIKTIISNQLGVMEWGAVGTRRSKANILGGFGVAAAPHATKIKET